MEEISLLKDYVTSLQRQIYSKNQELRTLTEENQKLFRQNQQLSINKSYVLNNSKVCTQCTVTKNQLNSIRMLCDQLQLNYNNLQRKTNTNDPNLSSVRLISSTCGQCSRVKRQNEDLRVKLDNSQKDLSRISTSKAYSTETCTDCPKLRLQVNAKDESILRLRSQISDYNSKITSLQNKIHTLNVSASRPVIYTQNMSRPTDLQRITYLNGQVEEYIALVNSLRSQMKILNQENRRYIHIINELQSRPRQIQYVQRQLGPQIRQQIRSLKIQIGQLSNDNILLRRQNATLKREVMNLPRNSQVIIQSNVCQHPRNFSPANFYQDRQGRHFRQSNIGRKRHQSKVIMQKQPFSQKFKHQDLQRKIEMLQMQNDYLKGTFYSEG